jgi:hypothetical protein
MCQVSVALSVGGGGVSTVLFFNCDGHISM